METVKYLVQSDVFHEDKSYPSHTFDVIKSHFPSAEVIPDEKIWIAKSFPRGIFRGSMLLASKMGEKFEYTNALNWAPPLKQYLFNREYFFLDLEAMLTGIELSPPESSRYFVRSASGNKFLAGQVFGKNHLWMSGIPKFVDKNTICMCSAAKDLPKYETRFIFVNGKPVAYSTYLLDGKVTSFFNDKCLSVPSKVTKFAEELGQNPYFDNIFNYVIDIIWDDNNAPTLLEINAFETSSFYHADLNTIYKAQKDFLVESLNKHTY